MKLEAKHVAASAFFSLLVCPGLAAIQDEEIQDEKQYEQEHHKSAKTHFVTVEDIEGAKVRLSPAGALDEELDDDVPSAEIKDALVRTDTGELAWVVVECEGREVLMPFDQLRWDSEQERFATDRSQVELKTLPDVDLDEAIERGLENAVAAAKRGWRELTENLDMRDTEDEDERVGEDGEAGEQGAEKRAQEAALRRSQIEGTEFYTYTEPYFRASQLDELELYSMSDEFGGVGKSIVDCGTGKVEFFVVNHGGIIGGVGGTDYLIPFCAVTFCTATDDPDSQELLLCQRTTEQLEDAVRYDEPDEGVLDAELAERARTKLPSTKSKHK